MVNKCRVTGCYINFQGYEIGAGFIIPTNEEFEEEVDCFFGHEKMCIV